MALGAIMFNVGTSMIFSGIAGVLAGDRTATSAEKSKNYFFDGPVNTVRQGNPVPIAYGKLIVGGAVINAQLTAEEQ
jgi:predicted phage tail protein